MKTCIRSSILLLFLLVLLPVDSTAGKEKLDSSLTYLMWRREKALTAPSLKRNMPEAAMKDKVVTTVKFDHLLSDAEISEFEAQGISFYYIGGKIACTGSIYPVLLPWKEIERFTGRGEVLRVESAWSPGRIPTLDVSARDIEADSVWYNCTDDGGIPLTGKGTRIAVFDTGIDVFHPSFFFADGDTLDWIDLNGSGDFESGSDAVDMNGNELFDPGEILRFTDGLIYEVYGVGIWGDEEINNNDNVYQTYWDWLYADLNGNGIRNFGPGDGFTEQDPTYGEPFFITLDDNCNGSLDPGEKLVALGKSKVFATYNSGGIERIRGVDLIYSDRDSYFHGTSTAGILAGGTPGRNRFTGIAPDAEILMANWSADYPPVSLLIPWARSHEADVMLYEWGGFVEYFLDGSSLDEQALSIEHNSTFQVTPSGNLAYSEKHFVGTVPDFGSKILQFYCIEPIQGRLPQEIYLTVLWRTEISDLIFRLQTPVNYSLLIERNTYGVEFNGYYVHAHFDTSPKGTCKFDLFITSGRNDHIMGFWKLSLQSLVEMGDDTKVICNVTDDISSFTLGMKFLNIETTGEMSVTSPGTADNSFTNGSYSTRGIGMVDYELVLGALDIGEISTFSGRGPRVDGMAILDLCTPGNYDVFSPMPHIEGYYPPGCYRYFGGTSAAGPHVAAGAALIKQAFPDVGPEDISNILKRNAVQDSYTGYEHNEDWGHGKMRLFQAVGSFPAVTGDKTPDSGKMMLGQNYPNPFNPTTWIPFYLPKSGSVSIKIYDVKGRLVSVLKDGYLDSGLWSVSWDGTNSQGGKVGSGVYFCTLSQNGERQTKKLLLLR